MDKAGLGNPEVTAEFSRAAPGIADLYYLHGDHLGSATLVTNSSGETTQYFLNLPFGETMVEQNLPGAYENPYKFNAKELDVETNLYYYGARYYNPRLSIWYGVDPLAIYNPVMETEFYGDGQHNGGVGFWGNLNPYIYTYQNPINFIDPNGKQVDLRDYGGGTVNFYKQVPYTNGKPGKYEYIRIQGDSSRPTTNVYEKMDNKTSSGYGTSTWSESNELITKSASIGFENSSTVYEQRETAEKGLNDVANAMVSVDQDIVIYGSSNRAAEFEISDLDSSEVGKTIMVKDLANKRSNKIQKELINRGVAPSNLKQGENKYSQEDRSTTLQYKVPKKQVLTADQLLNTKPKTGYDTGKKR